MDGKECEEVFEYAFRNSYFQTELKNLLDRGRHAGAAVAVPVGRFVEGLLSQTLIIHMIRKARVPFLQSWYRRRFGTWL